MCLGPLNPGPSAWIQYRIQQDSGRKPGMMGRATLSEQILVDYSPLLAIQPPLLQIKKLC